ncbi:MAG: glycosyltransferase family 4 protein [Verrucomicrobiota bacterium]|jgi:glycosyltransferase involved in cell wall biosynthesis|nr:glycosyltransferase family 4 protein [Verrucomicrobiota bacterium]
MRVAHVITRLIVGGAQENTVATVLGLRQKPDIDVRLYCGPTAGPEGSLEPLLDNIDGLFHLAHHLVRPVRPWNDWRAYCELQRAFESFEPDIVHTHSGKAGIVGRLAARRAGVPKIVHSIHGPSFGPFQGRLANALFRGAERFAGRRTDHFVTVADAMRDQYLAAGIGQADDYTRIPSGFDLQPFLVAENSTAKRASLGLAPGNFVIGKIARLFELKGHDDLFAIAPNLAKCIPNIRFLLVGDGIWRERFERLAKRIGCEKNFVFTGLVPPAEIPSLVGVMDALVHLSRREGLPRALPQAMAASKPVVSYDCDGAGEVCLDGKTGYLIKPGDQAKLKERLAKLAEDAALRASLGQAGRTLVMEEFTVEQLVERQYALYQRLLA